MDKKIRSEDGYSMIELIMVMAIIVVLAGVSIFYLANYQKLYKVDEQALAIVDMLQEARQKALTQRETVRVEIDRTANRIRLIEENSEGNAGDDRLIREAAIFDAADARLDSRPQNITTTPPEPMPVPVASFSPSHHPGSSTHSVCTVRFRRDGTVWDAGVDAIGTGGSLAGMTLYVWQPKKDSPDETELAKAITVLGGTGSVRMWEHFKENGSDRWRDARRSGYGQQGTTVSGNVNAH